MSDETPITLDRLPTSSRRWIGREVPRMEDPQLVTGRTEFIDNVVLPGMLHCAILRSPFAHARITRIDPSEAEKLPGVSAVLTRDDVLQWSDLGASLPEGWGTHCLATDKVRFVGEPVAAVAATSRYLAEDALELIEIDYEPLPVVVDAKRAMLEGSPLLFEEHGTNVMLHKAYCWGEVEAAFHDADQVFSDTFRWHRLGANPLETFGVISQWDPTDSSLTCRGSFQSPSHMALGRATSLRLPSNKVRLISLPHGGSFGGKGGARGTDITALLSRKAGGCPVKWIEDRMEYLLAGGSQSWDRHYRAGLAVTSSGKVTGLKVELIDDIGASGEGFGALGAAKVLSSFTGCYAIPAASYELTLVATNQLPGHPYRGMGPPPHNLVLEQMMDIAARGLGLDPAEMRRRNNISADQFPYTIVSGNEYDSGDYDATLDRALELADYKELRAQQARSREQGKLIGIGVASAIEPGVFDWNAYAMVGMPGSGVPEGATVGLDVMGQVTARVGFNLEGQGQFTLISQLLADYFGVEMSDVRVVSLDTQSAPPHFGPGGSRLGVAITGAVLGAAERLRDKLVRVAARLLQTDSAQVELFDGRLRLVANHEVSLGVAEVAGTMLARTDLLPPDMDPNPQATYVWTAPGRTQVDDQGRCKSYLTAANACHVVQVEIDPETGQVKILGYWIADDCGTRLNPKTVEGMLQGSVAQGVGAVLLEEAVYDDDGQLLTSSLMDYLLPTLDDVPMTEKVALVTPSPVTPLGAKGCGEGAMHTTPAAVLCAINDALAPLSVLATEVPASPNRIWKLLRAARAGAPTDA